MAVSHCVDKICQVIREEFHSLIIQMAQKTEAMTFDNSHLENTWISLHDFGTLQLGFVLDTFVNSVFVNFMTQSGATDEIPQPEFCFRQLLWEFQHKMLSRTSVARLLNKINNGNMLKEAIHGLPEQQPTLCWLETWCAARRGGKSGRRPSSVNCDVVSNAFSPEQRTHQTYVYMKEWCLYSRFFVMFGLESGSEKA